MSNEILAPGCAPPEDGKYVLRLYVVGNTRHSSRAIKNLKTMCEIRLKDRYDLTIVDLYEQPERAEEDQIVAVPTLVRYWPPPVRRTIGDLSKIDRVLAALDLPSAPYSP
jgi:circadian clock protein KaiB